jgi:transcriptional regulator with XRE-family HTH domain
LGENMDIGNKLKSLREKINLTTYDVSNVSGISQSVISKIENNNRKLEDIEILDKICNALGIGLIEFLKEDETDINVLRVNEAIKGLKEEHIDLIVNMANALKNK